MKKYLPLACAPLCLAALSACSILQPPDVGPQDNIVVSSSEPPTFEAKDVEVREVTENLAEPAKDEGLNVEYELQGLYSGGGGTVFTVKIHNLGELPLPADALPEPTLERATATVAGQRWTRCLMTPRYTSPCPRRVWINRWAQELRPTFSMSITFPPETCGMRALPLAMCAL